MSARVTLMVGLALSGCTGNAVPRAAEIIDIGTELVAPPMNLQPIAPVWDGETFAVAWIGSEVGEAPQLYFARINPASPITPGARTVGEMPFRSSWRVRQLFATTDGYVLFMRHPSNNEVHVAKLGATGGLLSTDYLLDAREAMAFQRTDRFDVVYNDNVAGDWKLHLRSFDADLNPLGNGTRLDDRTEGQFEPSLTWLPASSAYLVAWAESDAVYWNLWDPDAAPPVDYDYVQWQPFHQLTVRVLADASGNGLFRWHVDANEAAVFHYRSAADPVWEKPQQLFADNRSDSLDIGWAASDDLILIAWQSDVDHALGQIKTGLINPAAGQSSLTDVRTLTDGTHYFHSPQVAAGGGVFLVTYVGQVDGTDRVYYRITSP